METTDTDEQLIARASCGDRKAFETIIERHAGAVLRLSRAMASDDAAADDVVQEAFLDAYRSASTYRSDLATVRTWLFAIARNAARRSRRVKREEPFGNVEEPLLHLGVEAGWGADDALVALDERDRLAREIAALPSAEREVLVLRDLEGLSGEAAANVLHIELGALKSRLHRARLRLLAAMRASEGGVVDHQAESAGLRCSDVLAVLGDYVDGDLAPSERARVDAHLRQCAVCERFGGRYASVVHAARTRLGVTPTIDQAQLERIRSALRGG